MMHRCNDQNMVGPGSCELYHVQNGSFSMLYSDQYHGETEMYHSSSSVDCTLSLGTPSSRLNDGVPTHNDHHHHQSSSNSSRRSGGSDWRSKFGWDVLRSNKNSTRNGGSVCSNLGNDPLLARRCANCDTTSTPLWRNGPRGPKSLCNACGIRFKKEERRATAANNAMNGGDYATASGMMEQHQYHYNNYTNTQWIQPHQTQNQSLAYYTQENQPESDTTTITTIPFLSWGLNFTPCP